MHVRRSSTVVAVSLVVLTSGFALAQTSVSGPETPSPDAAGTFSQGTGVVVVGAPAGSSGGGTDDWKLTFHGYLRAPMRVGTSKREAPIDNQTNREIHSPRLPDDQYLNWNYTRQWERDWAELFFTYGNSKVNGTVGIQGFNFTDASYNNSDAQFGVSQGFVTVTPDLGVSGLRLLVKVGSFWNRYGMAGRYDAGKYDTYLFGRTHAMGEVVSAEYDVGDVTVRVSHGIGAKGEQGNCSGGLGCNYLASPTGFTLLNHFHTGFSYQKLLSVNAHYLASWAQDGGAGPKPTLPDGSLKVYGGEALVDGGIAGRLYAGFSRIAADRATVVGPAIEVVHSNGGGFYGLGVADQYLGPKSAGTGHVDTVMIQYDYSIGLLLRKLKNPNAQFSGDGSDITISLFGLLSKVHSNDPDFDGMRKLKFGTDVVWTPLSWFGLGVRADKVMPNGNDADFNFTVISPKLVFHSKFVTHEEITVQYSNYHYGAKVTPQAPLDKLKPDQNVFGVKCTMWW